MAEITIEDLIGSGADRTFPTGLSHAEMLTVTGLTNARLMSWYKRWKQPSEKVQAAPGRGNRRRYDVSLALFFLMRRVVADAGVALEDAEAVARRLELLVALRAGLDFDRTVSQAESELVNEDSGRGIYGMALIVPRFDGHPPRAGESEPLWRRAGLAEDRLGAADRFSVLPLERNLTELKLSHWMRKSAIQHGMLIDYWAAAVKFAAALAAVLAARKKRI